MPDRELQEELERVETKERISQAQAREEYSRLELERMRKEVKKEYGPNWRSVLGLAGVGARQAIVEGYRSLRRSGPSLRRMHGTRIRRF